MMEKMKRTAQGAVYWSRVIRYLAKSPSEANFFKGLSSFRCEIMLSIIASEGLEGFEPNVTSLHASFAFESAV